MSTPADPPLSRRAARQAESSSNDAQPEGFAEPAIRRGRGGQPVSVPSSAPTDVAYRTQVRPRVPHYDEAPPTHLVIAEQSQRGQANALPPSIPATWPFGVVEPLIEPPIAPSAAAGVQVRRRDFRPPAEQQPDGQRVAPAGATFDTVLEYHTQSTLQQDARPADPVTITSTAPPAQPYVVTPPVHSPLVLPAPAATGSTVAAGQSVVEYTLSRRELRALREQAGFSSELTKPAELSEPPGPLERPGAYPAYSGLSVEPAGVKPALVEPALVEPAAVEPAAVQHSQQLFSTAPPASSALTGSHWSVGIHDNDDPYENTLSREIGTSASLTNTNALILPQMPLGSIAGPVAGTGEIIITGMVDLSRAVSSTGTLPTMHESPDIDDLFEPGDLAAGPADAAPVSALRAVSSHTGTHGAMTSSGKRPSSNTITTVLVASTVIMAVVAIGLFVLAAVNGLF